MVTNVKTGPFGGVRCIGKACGHSAGERDDGDGVAALVLVPAAELSHVR
jgi:hypothetical protein